MKQTILKDLSEKNLKNMRLILENSKKEVIKILLDSKNKLDKDIQIKKEILWKKK